MTLRLCVMMFLQFFIWGAWFVSVAGFLRVRELDNPEWNIGGFVYSACPIAAMISPIFLGMVADRFFATQKVLGVMHLLGAGAMFLVARASGELGVGPEGFKWLLLAHTLCFMPTLGLSNTLAFHNIENQERQFPLIRVFGTIGWIVAGLFVGYVLGIDAKATISDYPRQFYASAVAALLLGIYSFTMPNTPPPAAGKKVSFSESLGLGALVMMKKPTFAVFMIGSFLTCIPLMAYYALTEVFVKASGFATPVAMMTWGQGAEVVFMLIMPLLFLRFGVKWMLAMGMLAWVLRYALFSFGAGDSAEDAVKWMIVIGILLHGICYDFFFVTGQIYVDKVAPRKIRGQAQGFLVLMTLGVGSYVGADVQYKLANEWVRAPAAAKLLDEADVIRREQVEPLESKAPAEVSAAEKTRIAAGEARVAELQKQAAAIRKPWKYIWMWPSLGALAILVLFVLLFRYRAEDLANGEEDDRDDEPAGRG